MKRFNPVALTLLVCGLSGCGLMKATGIMKAPPPNTTVTMKSTGFKHFNDDNNVIVVPTVYVRMPVEGSASASSDSTALHDIGRGESGHAKVSVKYKVVGLDKALAQDIAKAAYDDFVGKLRGAGYKVLTYDDVKSQEFVAGLDRFSNDAAYGLPVENGTVIATPTDDQAIKFTGSPISPYQRFGKSRFTEGTIVIPMYSIQAPLTKSETSSASASLTVVPGMALTSSMFFILTHAGAWGDAKLQKWVFDLSDNIGTVQKEDTTSHVGNAVSKTLSILGGIAGTNRKSASYTVTLDRNAYRAGVLKGLTSVNDETAKAIAAKK